MTDENNTMEQAVIVSFNYGIKTLDLLYDLDKKLIDFFSEEKFIEYDGYDVAIDNSDGNLYFYGHNAEHIFQLIRPVLSLLAS